MFFQNIINDVILSTFRKLGTSIPFRKKSKEMENQKQEVQRSLSGKDCVFKIVYKQVSSAAENV